MVSLRDLEQSEIDAVNLYKTFEVEHFSELSKKDIKRIETIIADEKDHLRIDRSIAKEHR